VLQKLGDSEAWIDLYGKAYDAREYRVCAEILRYMTDKRDGKPVIGTPEEHPEKASDTYDPRIQQAIANLHRSQDASTVPKAQALSAESAIQKPVLRN
jgi:hypothetical protein